MNEEDIIRKFEENGLILTTHGFKRVAENKLDADEILGTAKERKVWLITDEFISEFIGKPEEEKRKEIKTPQSLRKREILAKEVESQLEIYEDSDVTGKSTCEGTLENFVDYFNQKYNSLREILRDRPNLTGAVTIDFLKKGDTEGSMETIVMITDKTESRRGFRFLDVEDPTGELRVLIPKDNRVLNNAYERIMLDEVIGISGRLRNDLFIAEGIFQPELPMNHRIKIAEDPVSAVLTSDIHVGSYLFLEKEFKKFLDCLNLRGNNNEIFEKVKYVLVAGDLVDGIGVYPQQEKELSIPDIYKQYDFLASLLAEIPDYIEVILAMGNHDAVRNAEPQPRLPKDIGGPLYDLPNVHVVGNPVTISIHGIETLMYHGTSIDSVIGSLADCTYANPEIAMIEYLKRRYLVPSYGKKSISPERNDYLSIKEVPDILHCGHVHANGYADYRGVKVINSGAWQARTKYQEEQGHIPTPARVPIINLQSHEVSVVHF